MPQEQPILTFLNDHQDALLDVATVDDRKLRNWLADMDASTRAGVRRAWLVGRVLNAEKEKLEQGESERWMKARAKELGRSPRTLHIYRFLAENLDNPEIATALQISHADKGLSALLRAIRAERKKQSGTDRPAKSKAAIWRTRATRLLQALPKIDERVELLQELLEDVKSLLTAEGIDTEECIPPLPTGPTIRQATNRYLAHLRKEQRDPRQLQAATTLLNQFARAMGGDTLLADLSLRKIHSFATTLRHSPTFATRLPVHLEAALRWWREMGWYGDPA